MNHPHIEGDPYRIPTADDHAAAELYGQVIEGTFYMRQQAAYRSLGWDECALKLEAWANQERQRFLDAGRPLPIFVEEPLYAAAPVSIPVTIASASPPP